MAAPFRKRLTLFEEINRISLEGDSFRFELMEELTAEQENLINYRPYGASTQSSQDRMLQQYKNFVRIYLNRFKEDASDDLVEKMSFPSDPKVLITQLEFFMLFVARTNKGRSRESAKISYRTYTKYRAGMIFWCDWFYSRRDIPLIQKSKLFNKLTTAMQAAAEKWKLKSYGILNRTHVGLAELRQMIDHDMVATPCIELAECHHLAWCIGRVAAVRPGSIGPSRNGSKSKENGLYLKWMDVVLTRGEQKGMFDVAITFRNLKTNYERNYEAASKAGRQQKPLKVMIKAPRRIDNILFSVSLRLLIIALRRKILVGITTVDELLNGEYQFITIAPEFLDKPIMLASGPRGLSVKPDNPVMSGDLTDYLQLRGKKIGYESPIVFYSIRRRSATDMARVFGTDKARLLMGHDADSRVLEEYYMDYSPESAVSAALLNEPVEEETARMVATNAHLAIYKLSAEAVKQLHGAALNALIRKMVAADEDSPGEVSEQERKNYLRIVSRAAYKTLLTIEVQKQRETLTKVHLDDRVKALEQSNIMIQVLANAKQQLKAARVISQHAQNESDNITIDSVIQENNMFDETGELPEEDIDKQPIPETEVHPRETDEPDTDPDSRNLLGSDGPEVAYADAVQAFMDLVLDNTFNRSVDLKNDPQKCVLCAEDETVSDEQKNYLYHRHDTLREHMSGLYHTAKVKFGRWIDIDHQLKGNTTYACPYCPDTAPRYKTRKSLFKHIENSTPDNSSTGHDNQKRNDGWYDLDWAETAGETVNKKRREKRQANDRKKFQHRTGLIYSDKRALEQAILDPENKLFRFGGPAPEPSAKFMKYAEDCAMGDAFAITERGQKFVEGCDLWDLQTNDISDSALAHIEEDDIIE
ncbi:hypothetical protein B7494_g2017 [Chlorociboria aeruginascens]|nr:hypothetical protein B7494_g2017 [Chlorociboria aeruginascens]